MKNADQNGYKVHLLLFTSTFFSSCCLYFDQKLIIIPHRSLLSIPFEILVDHGFSDASWKFLQKSSDKDYSKINWLGKKHVISYYPSIYSFYNLNKLKFKQAKNDFVGFGDPILVAENKPKEINYTKLFTRGVANAEEIRNMMDELPETADELKSIAKIFKGNFRLYGPGHLCLFNPKSLDDLLVSNNFKVFKREFPYWKTDYATAANFFRLFMPWKISPAFYGSLMTYYAHKI